MDKKALAGLFTPCAMTVYVVLLRPAPRLIVYRFMSRPRKLPATEDRFRYVPGVNVIPVWRANLLQALLCDLWPPRNTKRTPTSISVPKILVGQHIQMKVPKMVKISESSIAAKYDANLLILWHADTCGYNGKRRATAFVCVPIRIPYFYNTINQSESKKYNNVIM